MFFFCYLETYFPISFMQKYELMKNTPSSISTSFKNENIPHTLNIWLQYINVLYDSQWTQALAKSWSSVLKSVLLKDLRKTKQFFYL
jgi:hypothetical protein